MFAIDVVSWLGVYVVMTTWLSLATCKWTLEPLNSPFLCYRGPFGNAYLGVKQHIDAGIPTMAKFGGCNLTFSSVLVSMTWPRWPWAGKAKLRAMSMTIYTHQMTLAIACLLPTCQALHLEI